MKLNLGLAQINTRLGDPGANLVKHLEMIERAKQADVDLLLNVARQMQGKCLCALGEFATMAVTTGIESFPQDFT